MAFIPASDFHMKSSETSLGDYQFGKKVIHHRFCSHCGVRPFAHGSDPKGNKFYAVRVNCLDGVDPKELLDAPVKYFDMLHDNMKSAPDETRHL